VKVWDRSQRQHSIMRPFDDISRLESATVLDKPAAVVRQVVQRLLSNRRVKDALHGVWLGHPLHPGAAQFALGSFVSATLIDSVGGDRRTSSGLIAAGLAMTAPTAAAGWADWSDSHEDQQRVGLVHAVTNIVAASCYAAALVRRRGGASGRLFSLAGCAIMSIGAILGGHLGYRQATGVNHAEEVAHLGPQDWQAVATFAELPDGRAVRRTAGEVPVFVLRRGNTVTVLSDRCPHLSAPLHEGDIVESDGDTRVICPWHGSEFRVADGCVVHGPATAPVPRFDSRVIQGELQARVVMIPGVPAS
jgi:nitrite reductase/ring-hydroxylating ferredoxin subunit/uncharacterized membrane protein